jgi:hypothetical protein
MTAVTTPATIGITSHYSTLKKENLMRNAALSTDRRNPTSSPVTAGNGECKSAGRRVRFDRTIGFCLGGAILGTAGCIMGACLPYHHPVAVTMSMLWWGIYLGCFGASVGGLIGMLAESAAATPSRGSDGTGEPSSGGDNWAFPAASGACVNGTPQTAKAVNNSLLAGRVLQRSCGTVTSSRER